MALAHTHRPSGRVYCIGMSRQLELVVGAIVSLLFMTYYWWGSLSAITGIYSPTVVTSILLLSICFILQRFSFKTDNTLYRQFLFVLSFYLIIYVSLNNFTISDQTWQEISRLSLWILASLMLHMLVLRKLSTKRILRIGLRLWVGICAITLGIKFILGEEVLFLLDVIAADGRGNINVVKDSISGISIKRFVVPGLNSNSVAIQCALMIPLLLLEKKKSFQLIFGLVLIAAGLLTYSRMFFVFLFVILIMYTLIYKSIKPLVYTLIISPLVLFTNSLVYYRMLNTIDGLFGTDYSDGLTKSSSDRSTLISDSILWIADHPWGGNIELMLQVAPGASGEHLLYLYLANILGLLFGLILFIYSLIFTWRIYRSRDLAPKDKLLSRSIILIILLSALVAPSYYIQLIWWPIIISFHAEFNKAR
jgi:hypothetical protein